MHKSPDKNINRVSSTVSNPIGDILSKTKKLVTKLSARGDNDLELQELRSYIELLEKEMLSEEVKNLIRYKLVFDNINSGIGFSDTKSKKIIELNPKFCEIFEIEQADYIGKDYGNFFDEFIIDKKAFKKGKEKYRKSGEISGFELPIRTKGGKLKYIMAFSIGIPEIGQEFFTIIDITEQKSVEKLRTDTENMLKHDLKGPLVSIGGYSIRLLTKYGLSKKVKKIVETILAESNKMNEMINSHFELMQMEQGKFEPRYETVNLVDVIEDIKEGFTTSRAKHSINFNLSFINRYADLNYNIIGDKKWIYSLFSNLIKNALEHSDKGEVIEISFEHVEKKSIQVKIHNNQPVPEQIRDRILVDKYVTFGKAGGTGLGIYSAKLITEGHNGKINIETDDKKGTTVSVVLKVLGKLGV